MNAYISDDGTAWTIVPLDEQGRELWDDAYTVFDSKDIPPDATLCFSK